MTVVKIIKTTINSWPIRVFIKYSFAAGCFSLYKMDSVSKIEPGTYIVIQRQKYMKLHKFGSADSNVMLGKQKIALRNIADQPYFTTFKMVPNEKSNNKSIVSLAICTDSDRKNLRETLGIQESGTDNRNIIDDGESQSLKSDDIDKLRSECLASSEIIEKIIENSKTFASKTEYSQEKYLRKKEKKYFEFVRIRKPTIRLLAEIYYRQNPDEIMGMRIDTLSQLVSYSGVCSFGNYMLYDSGSNGLLAATFLNSMGAGSEAKLVNLHPGNVPQRQAVLALNLPAEQSNRCFSVNLYSVLRQFYQGIEPVIESVGSKRKAPADDDSGVEEKKPRLESAASDDAVPKENRTVEKTKWQVENESAIEIMNEKFDGLVIAAREHPQAIVKALIPFLKASRPLVVYSPIKELLMELYVDLKTSNNVTALRLTSNWLRNYQILPNRTHPEINMTGNSGYLLTGYSVT